MEKQKCSQELIRPTQGWWPVLTTITTFQPGERLYTYYAYETSYVWDEKTQRKVQKKRCIGKFDPETDEIIPNGKRGRPRRDPTESSAVKSDGQDRAKYAKTISEVKALSSRLKSAEESFEKLSLEFQSISAELDNLLSEIQ